MAATNDPHEALFLMFKKLRDDDTGAGGLANTTGNQYLPGFIRSWEVQAIGSPPIPRIVFEVIDDRDESPFAGDSPSCMVRLHLFTVQDAGGAKEQAILTRMRTVYKGVPLSLQGGFNGGRSNWRRTVRAPVSDTNLNHRVVEITTKIGV